MSRVVCWSFAEKGRCKNGVKCDFPHDKDAALAYRAEVEEQKRFLCPLTVKNGTSCDFKRGVPYQHCQFKHWQCWYNHNEIACQHAHTKYQEALRLARLQKYEEEKRDREARLAEKNRQLMEELGLDDWKKFPPLGAAI